MLEQKKEYKTIEVSIGYLISQPKRRANKQEQILKVVDLIKELQKERGITDFSRKFLNDILKDFLTDRTRQRKVNELLSYATSQKQRAITKNYLVKQPHVEFKIKGELTKSKRVGIDLCWVNRRSLEVFYSFI